VIGVENMASRKDKTLTNEKLENFPIFESYFLRKKKEEAEEWFRALEWQISSAYIFQIFHPY
jgi:hypothetical protein